MYQKKQNHFLQLKDNIILNRSVSLYKEVDESISQDVILSIMITGVNILQNRK